MPKQKIFIPIASLILGLFIVWGLTFFNWTPATSYLAYAILVIFFLGTLVSNQQYEEDKVAKIQRIMGAFLLSYIFYFRLLYAPISRFFFENLISKVSFFSDLLTLFLFLIFFFLFGTTFLVINSYARFGFLSEWRIFNNLRAYYAFRILFFTMFLAFIMLYARNSFFSINNSFYLNKILGPATCNWTYVSYQNFLSTGKEKQGRDVCLYNYAQDRNDVKYCNLIFDPDVESQCLEYFNPGSSVQE
ncbi:MAG: hypothetical protein WC858_00290 [Parcubacteria group bacterium]